MLPPQIDGSTLRTLCLQHGPLITFHLNLTQGNAVVRYSSKEEAAKAQKSLHMYVPLSQPCAARWPPVPQHTGASCPGATSTAATGLCATGVQSLTVLGPGSLRSSCHQDWLLLRPLSSACRQPSFLCPPVVLLLYVSVSWSPPKDSVILDETTV